MFSSNGHISGQKVFLMTKSSRFLMYSFICFISGDSASYFLGMITLYMLFKKKDVSIFFLAEFTSQ